MLNLFNNTLNNKNEKVTADIQIKPEKHFPVSVREWKNSIYYYNKNIVNVTPSNTLLSLTFIKSYFALYSKITERKMRAKRLTIRLRKLSSNKIYIDKGEFKHTNNKVLINLYTYNRQKFNYLVKLEKEYLKHKLKFTDALNIINLKAKNSLTKSSVNKSKILDILLKDNSCKIDFYANITTYIIKFYKKLTEKVLKKLKIYFYYKHLTFINNTKYNFTFLLYLNKYLESIYNKNIQFNLINVNRFYLNSDILAESITLKLTRNRKNILKILNILKTKVRTEKEKFIFSKLRKRNISLKAHYNYNALLLNNFISNKLKYKKIGGFRLEASGRLTKRYTASKSMFKTMYKGSLLNLDSSYKGLSSVILKNNLRSNLQYTKMQSKTRIGSFGIKTWVSAI